MGKATADDMTARWTKYGVERLEGRKITKVRYMTAEESIAVGFDGHRAIVLQLDNGAMIFPSTDCEGNGPGALFGSSPPGSDEDWTFPNI